MTLAVVIRPQPSATPSILEGELITSIGLLWRSPLPL